MSSQKQWKRARKAAKKAAKKSNTYLLGIIDEFNYLKRRPPLWRPIALWKWKREGKARKKRDAVDELWDHLAAMTEIPKRILLGTEGKRPM